MRDWAKEPTGNVRFSASMHATPILKILLTGRPDGAAFELLGDFPTLAITAEDTKRDIQTLIRSRCESLAHRRHLKEDAIRLIIGFLEAKSEGMFLWVVLVLEGLERRDERLTNEVISTKLSTVPLTLLDTYEAILRNVSPSRQIDMWRIYRWLFYSPRNLTVTELEAGLCLETGESGWYDLAGDVEYLCGSLIRFDAERQEFTFAHQTARGFLENFIRKARTEDVSGLNLNVSSANEHLATTCIAYIIEEEAVLTIRQLVSTYRTRSAYSAGLADILHKRPFLRYAIQSWHFHVHATGAPSQSLMNLLQQLFSMKKFRDGMMTFEFYINKNGSGAIPVHQTPLHMAAYFNIHWLVDYYIAKGKSVDEVSTTGDTALVWASEMGSTECVKKLLKAGADPNHYEYDGWSALHWAARNGRPEETMMLLEYGARLEHTDSKGYIPLDWAQDRQDWDVAQILERTAEERGLGHVAGPRRRRKLTGNQLTWQLWDWRP